MRRVLFVCVENSCRSQMAEAFFNKYAKNASASSAGSKPAKSVDSIAVEIMKEAGFNLHGKIPNAFSAHLNKEFDFIVKMGCKDACPITPKEKTIEWDIADPKGKDISDYRKARDDIEQRVKRFISESML